LNSLIKYSAFAAEGNIASFAALILATAWFLTSGVRYGGGCNFLI
jgi:hypothetical protein